MNQAEPTFFIDRCLGKRRIIEALTPLNVNLEVHDDHFSQTTLDVEWIPEIGKRGWIIFTKDAAIGRNAIERQTVARANLRMFSLTSQNLSGKEMAEIFRLAMPKIKIFLEQHPAPFIAKIYRDGSVKAWKSASDLLAEIQSSIPEGDRRDVEL